MSVLRTKTPEELAVVIVELLRYTDTINTNESFQAFLTTHQIQEPELTSWLRQYGIQLPYEEILKLFSLKEFMKISLRTAVQVLQRVAFESLSFDTCYDQAVALGSAGDNIHAIMWFQEAIQRNKNAFSAWYGCGLCLKNLDQWATAVKFFEAALSLNPRDASLYQIYAAHGTCLSNLEEFEQSITSYDTAFRFEPYDFHKSTSDFQHQIWLNRSHAALKYPRSTIHRTTLTQRHPELTQSGYEGELASLNVGLTYCPVDTNPFGHGFLQRGLGDAHLNHAKLQQFPRPYWRAAITAYKAALRCLTAIDYPEERLLTLQALIRTHLALNEIPEARDYQTEAIPLYNQLRDTAPNKRQFEIKYLSLSRTEIDLLLGENSPIRALEQAEFYKNRTLAWILDDWESQSLISLTYAEMRSTLTPETAIVYWHLSDDALTTFILTHTKPDPIVLKVDRYSAANKLIKLINEYKKQYKSYGEDQTAIDRQNHPWRQQLSQWIETLKEILDIGAIETHLTHIKTLILIPHRDLHLLPLHTLFPQTCTYLPSITIGTTQRPLIPTPIPLLNIDDPTTSLKYAQLESAVIRALIPLHSKLSETVNQEDTIVALTQRHSILHFSGHGTYDTRHPENSGIFLTDRLLTAKTIAALNLSTYRLISLAACETGITGKDDQSEYIGLSSAFLKAKASNILSTLWQVDELSSFYLIIKFYQTYLNGESPAKSLAIAQTWLQTLTYPELATWITHLHQDYPRMDYHDLLVVHGANIQKVRNEIQLGELPFEDAYHWAGFTIVGCN